MMTDLQQMLIQQEGTGPRKGPRFLPYLDTVGKVTIGYGRNLDDKGISPETALSFFNEDIADAIEDVRHVCSIYDALSRPRQLVMVSLAFNLGRIRLGKFVRFLGALHREAWDEAADELLDSAAATQAPVRYQHLAAMLRDNVSEWV